MIIYADFDKQRNTEFSLRTMKYLSSIKKRKNSVNFNNIPMFNELKNKYKTYTADGYNIE